MVINKFHDYKTYINFRNLRGQDMLILKKILQAIGSKKKQK